MSKITEEVWSLSAELLWSIILHAENGRCEHSTKEQSQKATLQLCSNGPDSGFGLEKLASYLKQNIIPNQEYRGHHYRCYWSYAQHKNFCCSKRDILHMAPSNKVSQLRRQSTLVETLVVKISCEDDRFLSCVCQASEGDALFCRDRSQKLLCLTSFRTSTAFITNLLCCSKKSFEVDDGPREGLRRRVPSVFCKWERPQVLRLSWIRALPRNVFLEVRLEKLGVLNPPGDAGLPKMNFCVTDCRKTSLSHVREMILLGSQVKCTCAHSDDLKANQLQIRPEECGQNHRFTAEDIPWPFSTKQ